VSFTNVVSTPGPLRRSRDQHGVSVNTTTLSNQRQPDRGSYSKHRSAQRRRCGQYTLAPLPRRPNYTISPLALAGKAMGRDVGLTAGASSPGVSFTNCGEHPGPLSDLVTSTASVNTTTLTQRQTRSSAAHAKHRSAQRRDAGNYTLAPSRRPTTDQPAPLAVTRLGRDVGLRWRSSRRGELHQCGEHPGRSAIRDQQRRA